MFVCRATGRVYYKNSETHVTQWERPADFIEPGGGGSSGGASAGASADGSAITGVVDGIVIEIEALVHHSSPVPEGYRGVMLLMPHASVASTGQAFRLRSLLKGDVNWYTGVVPPGVNGGDLLQGLVRL